LGMIKRDEVFYQIVENTLETPPDKRAASLPPSVVH